MITQTLKMVFNIRSTRSHLGVDKSYSNLIYIPIAERIPLTNHAQIIMLTKRRLQCSDNFLLFIYIVFTWNVQLFIPIALYPHEIKLLQSWLIFCLDTCACMQESRKHQICICFSSLSCLFKEVMCVCCHLCWQQRANTADIHLYVCLERNQHLLIHHTDKFFFIEFTYVWLSVFVHTLCVCVYVCGSPIQVHPDDKAMCFFDHPKTLWFGSPGQYKENI